MDFSELEKRVDVLLDLMRRIVPGAAKTAPTRTATLDEKGRALSLTEAMDYLKEQDRERSFQYGEACNEVGRQMRARIPARDCRPTLTEKRRAVDHAEEDQFSWADGYNTEGERQRRERR